MKQSLLHHWAITEIKGCTALLSESLIGLAYNYIGSSIHHFIIHHNPYHSHRSVFISFRSCHIDFHLIYGGDEFLVLIVKVLLTIIIMFAKIL